MSSSLRIQRIADHMRDLVRQTDKNFIPLHASEMAARYLWEAVELGVFDSDDFLPLRKLLELNHPDEGWKRHPHRKYIWLLILCVDWLIENGMSVGIDPKIFYTHSKGSDHVGPFTKGGSCNEEWPAANIPAMAAVLDAVVDTFHQPLTDDQPPQVESDERGKVKTNSTAPQHQDGPQEPNRFWWEGQYVKLQPIPWGLVEMLWNNPGNKAAIEDGSVEEIWGKMPTSNALKQAIHRINESMLNALPTNTGSGTPGKRRHHLGPTQEKLTRRLPKKVTKLRNRFRNHPFCRLLLNHRRAGHAANRYVNNRRHSRPRDCSFEAIPPCP